MAEEHISDEQLIAYAVGELDQVASSSVTAHTSNCAECTATVVRVGTIRGLMRSDLTLEPPVVVVAQAQAIFRHPPDEQLIGYAAGDLTEREAALVAVHLSACADCAATVAHFRTIRELFHDDDTVEPPPAIIVRAQAIFRHFSHEQLIAYATGESDMGESAAIAAHLTTCADCASTVTRFRTVRQLVRGDFSIDPPSATILHAQTILRRHRTAPQPSRSRIGIGWWLQDLFPRVRPFVAASVALLLFAFLLALGQAEIGSSETAIPGDTLYAVKLNAEIAQTALSLDPVGKAQLLLGLTEKRVDEMVALNASGRDKYIPETATRYENLTDQVMVIVGQLAKAGDGRALGLGAVADTILSRNIGILTGLFDKVTEQVRSAVGDAITVSKKDLSAIHDAVVTMNSTPTSTPALSSTQTPGVVSTPTRPKVPGGQTPVPTGQPPISPGQQSQPPVAPSETNVRPVATSVPPSPTKVPPAATPVPPSATRVPPSATPVPPSPTNEPPVKSKTPPGQATKFALTPGATKK